MHARTERLKTIALAALNKIIAPMPGADTGDELKITLAASNHDACHKVVADAQVYLDTSIKHTTTTSKPS